MFKEDNVRTTLHLILALVVVLPTLAEAKWFKRKYPKHMKSHQVCGKDTRLNKKYCLEVIEFEYKSSKPKQEVAMLVSGFFQNAYIWDLLPEDNISLAEYMMENYGIHPYVLHVRGIGNSDYLSNTNLDDIAIDDIPMGLNFISQKEMKQVILMGHSQGAITSLASMSGLTRCGRGNNCFKTTTATKRQSVVKRLALLAGNSAMTMDRPDNFLFPLAPLGWNKTIQHTLKWIDRIDIEIATKFTGPISFISLWDNLYVLKNVGAKARKALWKKTVDTTTGDIIVQFANAIKKKGIRSVGGHAYTDFARNVKVPVIQQTYEYDQLAEPWPTKDDTFSKIGSSEKVFDFVANCAHEDFFMSARLHQWLDPVFNFVTR
jgi:pimeloyl-ACP methyl ester carboxylesterase